MSMPAPHRPALTRRAALAAGLGMVAALTACSNHEAMKPYQPAAGVETNTAAIQARNIMFVSDGADKGFLHGTFIAMGDDELTGIKGVALKADNSADGELTIKTSALQLPKNQGVDLSTQKLSTSGLTQGGLTRLTFTFKQAGDLTLTVPVVDAKSHNLEPNS